ncbi:hypothetical protein [Altererythrobacter sp. MF3-039]|uniref:hypothetical protein n=1 Tax=Altererythrobacter sp. MF3-039 TaxID=3252901 RepID=UPI00390C7CB6
MRRFVSGVLVLAMVSACASSKAPPRSVRQVIERALENAPGEAQPGKIVAAEVGFAKMAREEGQWTAFRHYAAPGGLMHLRDGPVAIETALAGQEDPEAAVQWAPRAVWMSCDASLAVSTGRFRYPNDLVGQFVTVWQRQANDDYRWVYDGGSPDDPQPAPRPEQPLPLEDEIVVAGIDSITGIVADCPAADAPLTASPVADTAAGIASGAGRSRDGTLVWRWEHHGEGKYRLVASYWTYSGWQTPLDVTFPRSGGE